MKYLFTLLLLFGLSRAGAQSTIAGRITDDQGESLAFANVTLHRAADSSLVKGALSGEDGRFLLEAIPYGEYVVQASFVGYTSVASAPFTTTADRQEVEIGALRLATSTATLDAVTVQAKKPFIERRLDKLVVNVENSIVSAGASALEVLERSPNVFVDHNGNISLKGKQGVIIMMDDKPVQLSGEELANLLRGMPSSSIETIEIIANPSARYDAEGNAGIINLKTKRDQRLGTNGNITLTAGHGRYERANTALNVNFRDKKWNLFANYSFAWSNFFNNLRVTRKFRQNGIVDAIYDHDNLIIFPFRNHVTRFGADFFPSKKTTIGILVGGISNRFKPRVDNSARIFDGNGQQTGSFFTTNRSQDGWYQFTTNLNAKIQLDTSGRNLNADLDFARYWNHNAELFNTQLFDAENILTRTDYLRGDTDGLLHLYSAKADYVHPLAGGHTLEAGFKASLVNTDNDLKYFIKNNGEEVLDDRQSNHFLYRENINAVYLNWSLKVNKWSFQFGLRGEQTVADGDQITIDSSFSRNYFQVFPSAFLNYEASEKHQFGISLSRRINRPDYRQLNPFRGYVDPSTFQEGNPYLRPELTYSAELSHTLGQRLTTTFSYSITDDAMTQVILQNDAGKYTVVTFINIARYEYLGLGFNAPLNPTDWWTINGSLNAYWNRFKGQVAGYDLNEAAPTFNLNLTNTVQLPRDWSLELGGFYQHRQVYSISFLEPIWSFNAGLQKSFWEGKGMLRFNMRDIFYRGWPRGGTEFGNIDEVFESRRETRVGTLAFTWRFGKKTVEAARRRSIGAEEELRRAGGTG